MSFGYNLLLTVLLEPSLKTFPGGLPNLGPMRSLRGKPRSEESPPIRSPECSWTRPFLTGGLVGKKGIHYMGLI